MKSEFRVILIMYSACGVPSMRNSHTGTGTTHALISVRFPWEVMWKEDLIKPTCLFAKTLLFNSILAQGAALPSQQPDPWPGQDGTRLFACCSFAINFLWTVYSCLCHLDFAQVCYIQAMVLQAIRVLSTESSEHSLQQHAVCKVNTFIVTQSLLQYVLRNLCKGGWVERQRNQWLIA